MDRNKSGPGDQTDTKAIDDYLKSKMKSFRIPGLALSIVKNDQIVYLKGYGRSNVRGKPVTPQTTFYIASVYKSFIGLGISQLIEAGKIEINAPVKTYLPWFTLADPEAARQITIRHLLSHTSGLSTRSGVIVLYTNPVSLEQLVRNIANTRISEPVGSKYQYSNLNYFILAEVIQKVSGMPYGQYIEANIFKPLDMRHSYTSQAEAKKNGLATGYTALFGFMTPFVEPERKASIHLMVSSEDIAHYMVAQLNNGTYGGNSVISSQGMARTHTPLFPFIGPELYHYGMGWAIKDSNIAHNGAMQNFRADIFMRNGENGDKWGVAVLVNSMDIVVFDLTGEVPYGNISFDIIQLLHGQKSSNNYSPFKITFSNIGKVVKIYLLYLLAAIVFLTSSLRNSLRSK
jgi:CubicO group peptidase (beta-lactamase class C family)